MTDLETIVKMLNRAGVAYRLEQPNGLSVIIVTIPGTVQSDPNTESDWRFKLDGSLIEVECCRTDG